MKLQERQRAFIIQSHSAVEDRLPRDYLNIEAQMNRKTNV